MLNKKHRYIVTISFTDPNTPDETFSIPNMPPTHAALVAQDERQKDPHIDLISIYDKRTGRITYC